MYNFGDSKTTAVTTSEPSLLHRRVLQIVNEMRTGTFKPMEIGDFATPADAGKLAQLGVLESSFRTLGAPSCEHYVGEIGQSYRYALCFAGQQRGHVTVNLSSHGHVTGFQFTM